jgi:hypothetical protein
LRNLEDRSTGPGAQSGEVLVRIETAMGGITVAVDTKRAPITSGNFLKYVST